MYIRKGISLSSFIFADESNRYITENSILSTINLNIGMDITEV